MHKTDLLTMPHWERVMFRLEKLLRGTSMVSIRTCLYRFPDISSAVAMTSRSVSVGWNWHFSLWPHGVLRASRIPEPPVSASWHRDEALTVPLDTHSISWSLKCWVWSLDLKDFSSMSAQDASSDLFSIDGRTLYLFSDITGMLRAVSPAELILLCLKKARGDGDESNLWFGVGGGRGG